MCAWERLTRYKNRRQSHPRQPGDTTQCSHTTAGKPYHGSDGDKHCSTHSMRRHRVQPNRDSEDSRSGHEDPVCRSASLFAGFCGESLQRQNAPDNTPFPTSPKTNCPASSMLYTWRWWILNLPITYADHVVITDTTNRQIIPGTMPSELNAPGTDSSPRPICVFIIRITVPTKPT